MTDSPLLPPPQSGGNRRYLGIYWERVFGNASKSAFNACKHLLLITFHVIQGHVAPHGRGGSSPLSGTSEHGVNAPLQMPISGAEAGFFYLGSLIFHHFKRKRFSRSFPPIPAGL